MTPIKLFMNIVIATVFFIAANVLGGALNARAEDGNEFEMAILRDSLIKYLAILVIAGLLYAGGYFGDEVLKDYTNEYVNIKNIVAIGLAAYAVDRAADATGHWIKLVGLKIKKEED